MSSAINVVGSTVSIGTTATDLLSDAYTAIGEVTNFDGPGGSSTIIDVSSLDSAAKEKRKGLKDNGQFTFTANCVFANAGQVAIRAAQDDTAPYNIRLVASEGTTAYFKALITQARITGGGVDDILKLNVVADLTGEITWA